MRVLHPLLFGFLEKLFKAYSCLYSSSLGDLESKCKHLWGGWGAGTVGDEGLWASGPSVTKWVLFRCFINQWVVVILGETLQGLLLY